VEAIRALRDSEESDLIFLSNLTAVDQELHFEIVYHLQSLDLNHILQIKALWSVLLDRFHCTLDAPFPAPNYGSWVTGPRLPCRLSYRRRPGASVLR